jgi:hypothetical protein
VGTEEAFAFVVLPAFFTEDGGDGFSREADTIVVAKEQSKGSPRRKDSERWLG